MICLSVSILLEYFINGLADPYFFWISLFLIHLSYISSNHPSLALMANQTDQMIKLINLVTTKITYIFCLVYNSFFCWYKLNPLFYFSLWTSASLLCIPNPSWLLVDSYFFWISLFLIHLSYISPSYFCKLMHFPTF